MKNTLSAVWHWLRWHVLRRLTPLVALWIFLMVPGAAVATAAPAPAPTPAPTAPSSPTPPTPTPSPSRTADPCKDLPPAAKQYCYAGSGAPNPDAPDDPAARKDLVDSLMSWDCKAPPAPEVPGAGLLGWIDSGPAKAPATRPPTAPDATSHLYEQYGYAGLHWNTYQLACAGNVASDASGVFSAYSDNWVANKLFTFSKFLVALTVVLRKQALSGDFLKGLDPVVETCTKAVHDAIFTPWIGTSLLILGCVIIFQARKRDVPAAVTQGVWAVLVMALATGVANYPLEAANYADKTMNSMINEIDQRFATAQNPDAPKEPGQPGSDTAYGNMLVGTQLYTFWLRGELGDANSEVAKKYGPQLFDAQSMTWDESRTAALPQLVGKKAKAFDDIAAKIKKEDPIAYTHLTGKSEGRVGTAALSLGASGSSSLYGNAADMVIIAARIIVRLVVILLPALAVVGLHRRADRLVKNAVGAVAGAVIAIPIFGATGAIQATAVTSLATGPLPGWLSVLIMWLITILLWKMSKPFRRLGSMLSPGANPFTAAGEALGGPGRTLRQAVKYGAMARVLRNRGGRGGQPPYGPPTSIETTERTSPPSATGGLEGPQHGTWWDNGERWDDDRHTGHTGTAPQGGGPRGGGTPGAVAGALSPADPAGPGGGPSSAYAYEADTDGPTTYPSAGGELDAVWDVDGWYIDDPTPARPATPALPAAPAAPAGAALPPAAQVPGRVPGARTTPDALPPANTPAPAPDAPPAPQAPGSPAGTREPGRRLPPPRAAGTPQLTPGEAGVEGGAPYGADMPYADAPAAVVPPAITPDDSGVYVIWTPDAGRIVRDDRPDADGGTR